MIKSLFSALCAHHIDMPNTLTKPINYIMAKNGCFEIRQTPLGQMTIRVEEDIAGLNSIVEEGIELDIPLIPGRILTTVVKFFRAVYHAKNGAEAFLQIFYQPNQEQFFLHCPKQQVSGSLVKFERDPELESENILVMDIHSHNSMPAFFSTIDDRDEKEDRLYGVVGCVHQRIPHLAFRMGVAGRFLELEGRSLFDQAELAMDYPAFWLDQCEHAPLGHHRRIRTGPESETLESSFAYKSHTIHTASSSVSFSSLPPRYAEYAEISKEEDVLWSPLQQRHSFSPRRRKVESWGPAWDLVLGQAGEWVEDVQPSSPTIRRTWL